MTQLLDPSGPYSCVWSEELDGCDIPEPAPLINPHISEAEKLCFAFGCDAPPRDLSAPAPVPLPEGGVLLGTVLLGVLVLKSLRLPSSLTAERGGGLLPAVAAPDPGTAGNPCDLPVGTCPITAGAWASAGFSRTPILSGDRQARAVERSPN